MGAKNIIITSVPCKEDKIGIAVYDGKYIKEAAFVFECSSFLQQRKKINLNSNKKEINNGKTCQN